MSASVLSGPPAFADIVDAAERLSGKAVRTPLLECPFLNEITGGRLLVKAEPLQKTGSFKFRGAYNTVSRIDESRRPAGVVGYSSGNHAQGVAAAAQMLGIPATIIMPEDAPTIKIENTRAYGAEVIFYDRFSESREEISKALADQRGATLVMPYENPYIIAGQGTVGLEIAQQVREMGLTHVDAVLINCGGGGLIAGCATALNHELPDTEIYAVEPEGFDDTTRSLKSGRRETVNPAARSICDAILTPTPGELTFSINSQRVTGGLVVSDEEVLYAMKQAFLRLKLIVEPGGAASLAAALTGKYDSKNKTIVVVCSGGNVDPAVYIKALK